MPCASRRAAVLLLLLTVLVPACGGEGPASTPSSSAPAAAPPSEPPLAHGVYVSPTGTDTNPGTQAEPLRSIEAGLARLRPGLVLVLLDGTWKLTGPLVVRRQGAADAWVEIRGAKGTTPVLDASAVDIPWAASYPWVQGAVQVEGSAYVRVRNVHVRTSRLAGFNVAASHHVEIVNCSSRGSFASGISAWQGTSDLRVLGNTVTGANDMALSIRPFTGSEAPHEAISIAGTVRFEVAWNDVGPNKKEGIDVKETAAHGVVHHNWTHQNDRQGIYVDGWFGVLEDVEVRDNVVSENEVGIAISSEDGPATRDVRFHHNLVFANRASGFYFSRWGKDNPREDVSVTNNTFYRNGYGRSASGDPGYWLSGGLYLHSTNVRGVVVRDNVFALDKPFEIGYSGDFGGGGPGGRVAIDHNLVQDTNTTSFPFYMATWAKDYVWSTSGVNAILADPQFFDAAAQDFRPRPGSPAAGVGALEAGSAPGQWWKAGFPPEIQP
jgi:hypothetical protein